MSTGTRVQAMGWRYWMPKVIGWIGGQVPVFLVVVLIYSLAYEQGYRRGARAMFDAVIEMLHNIAGDEAKHI